MKYKSRPKSLINLNILNNSIPTYNLKIKNIHILLDDITTDKASKNLETIKRSNSLQNHNVFSQKFSFNTYSNSHTFIYNKKKLNSKKRYEEKDKSLKSIPITFRKTESYKNTESATPSFLTTMEGFYSSNLTSLVSEKNVLNKTIISNKINYNDYNDIKCNIDELMENNKIYIKKHDDNTFKYNYRKSFNKKSVTPIILKTKKIYNNNVKEENLIQKSKTLNLNNNQDSLIIREKSKIEKKKIKFNINNKINKNESKNSFFKKHKYFSLNIEYISLIQRWWKKNKFRITIKKNAIIIQKAFRTFLKRKQFNIIKRTIIDKIPKNNTLYFISKVYYKNNIIKIIFIQNYFKSYLAKNNFYDLINFNSKQNYCCLNIKKPEIRPCYFSKINNLKSYSSIKSITFAKKKLDTISKRKRNLKFKSLMNNYNSFSYNFTNKSYNLKSEDNSPQSINNSESHDYNKNDIINKITNDIMNQKDINIVNMNMNHMFVRYIFQRLNSILFQVGYKYKSILYFINSLDWVFIKNKIDLFFENLSFFSARRINFIKNICRHINIYKRNNFIKNEIIELIEKNLTKRIDYENIDYRAFKLSSEQENNLINNQIFKEDNNLINYIYLFFKYEKNKKMNKNFIENRLKKEPLNYRNIFTIVRYIDNLDEKITTNKICTNCFCKKNERVCSLNCNCHFLVNIINRKSHDFNLRIINKDYKTYQMNKENISNNLNLLNTESKKCYNDFKKDGNDPHNNYIKEIRINKTFHYFNI